MASIFETLQGALAGRYTLLRELGRGGMAVVFLAEELSPRRQVAIKVLEPTVASAVGYRRFRREVDLSATLSHPHIVPIFAAGEAEGLLYYVMPYLTGESLRDRLEREGPLPVAEALRIGAEVADALDYAHRNGVIHRDIKPENILLQAGQALVADFGVARAVLDAGDERLTLSGDAVGTPLYMSPEQVAGGAVDARSDVYSLACVAYEMLAGAPPLSGPTPAAVMMQHVSEMPEAIRRRRPRVSETSERAVARGLAKSPGDRWQTAGEFAAALRAAAGQASAERRAGFWARARVPWQLWAGALGVVVGLLALNVVFHPLARRVAGPRPSVAVLYFDNLSRDTADLYLADGFTEEIMAKLGQVGRLATISRAAVRRFRGTSDPTAAARELGARYLVTGSLRRSANRVRVAVEMDSAEGGGRLWGEEYDRAGSDILAVEEDVASRVAEAVVGALLPTERAAIGRRPTRDPQAYDRFLHGNFDLGRRTPQAVARAIAEFGAAAALDPRFSEALARAAMAYGIYLDWNWPMPGVPAESLLARGTRLADSALALDSMSSDGWMARGLLLSKREPRTYQGVLPAFERAIALDPRNAEAWHQYGSALRDLGLDSAATSASLRALAIEPDRAITLVQLGLIALADRNLPEADRWLDSAAAADPSFVFTYGFRSAVHAWQHDTAAARADAEMAQRLTGGYSLPAEAAFVVLDASTGQVAAARRRASRLASAMLDSKSPPGMREGVYTAAALATAGDTAKALEVLERTRPRGTALWAALSVPWFDGLRSSARFRRLAADAAPPPGAAVPGPHP